MAGRKRPVEPPTCELQTQRLSPNHQLTLPREADALAGDLVLEKVSVKPYWMARPDAPERKYPVLLIMTREEVRRRIDQIRQVVTDPHRQTFEVNALVGDIATLAVDSKRRVVLPPVQVRYLNLDRDVYVYSSDRSVVVWNPQDWLAYLAPDRQLQAGAQAFSIPMV